MWTKRICPPLFEMGENAQKAQQGRKRDAQPLLPLTSYLLLTLSENLNQILSFQKGAIKTLGS